jgi:hypothetical protein
MYSALIIHVEKTKDFGDIVAIARAEAKKKSGIKNGKIMVHEIQYFPRIDAHVAVFSVSEVRERRLKNKKWK